MPTKLRRPLVLMYHGFTAAADPLPGCSDPHELLLPIRRLEEQLTHLRDRGYEFLDVAGYLRALERPVRRRRVLVTIDDGMRSVGELAAPVLQAHGVPSVLFVSVGLVTGAGEPPADEVVKPDGPLLSADELQALPATGMELGVHGWDHSSLVGADVDALRLATAEARSQLTDLTGTTPRAFAYPYGWHDERAAAAVRDSGFDVGFSLYNGSGRHAIDRVDVKPGDTLTAFRVKCVPGYRSIWRASRRVPAVSRAARTLTWRRG
ncbi:polysaccharide deacetylase family protein [Geodermatophilus sp. DF01_2]|uniref:polysaccharide deacetylase family protein n=1 Tax=Geodermatophilus sp. DF01-2 TaxID=2559610 RepID=UPI0014304126|nr:polysaccharide deacetylase family protein [Geodermatophilus sp. DF01_2]